MVWLGVPEIDGRVRPHLPLGDGYRCKMQHMSVAASNDKIRKKEHAVRRLASLGEVKSNIDDTR